MKFQAGADHTAFEKPVREEEGENNPAAMEITHDGDFMVMRKKGLELPAAGSEERAKLFADTLGESDKPVVVALIFNDPMIKSIQKEIARGAPAAVVAIVTDSKWLRIDLSLGETAKAEATIQTADEEAGKRMADAVTGLGDFMKVEGRPVNPVRDLVHATGDCTSTETRTEWRCPPTMTPLTGPMSS